MQKLPVSFIAGTVLLISACTIHKPEVQQGNVLTPEMIAQLHPGLNKKQVRFIMGTPAISDAFHPNQWNYVYWLVGENGKTTRKELTVIFENDAIIRLAGDGVTLPATPQEQAPQSPP